MAVDEELWTNYFTFLDNLRESGVTNMYGASSYLTDAFDISKSDAMNVLGRWMETFGDEPAIERVRKI